MQGTFITLEGIEGAGKSTLAPKLVEYIKSLGHDVELVREPGGTYLAEQIRGILKAKHDEPMHDLTELLLMYSARCQLLNNFIKPKLNEGVWVVCDRFDLSTFAYQGGGRFIPMNIINFLHNIVLDGFEPDLTLILDVRPSVGMGRVKSRGETDRFEQETLAFFNRVRETYLSYAYENANTFVIDAHKSHDAVLKDCIDTLNIHLLFG